MEKVIAELHYDKDTYFSLVVVGNFVLTRCFYLNTGIIEERAGGYWFYTNVKKCILKNIKKNIKEFNDL